MKKLSLLASVAVAAVLFSGCSQHMGNFTALSTDAFNPQNIDDKHKVASNVESDVMSLNILGVPVGGIIKLDQAVSETAHNNNGDFLKNAQVYHKAWGLVLFGEAGYEIKADVYKTQE